ncbi:MAG: DUF952 domain-containing protein [Thermoflexales bacterium]|nr:DUF952 domain-containing protein [Thermoflexales bacterium]
MSEERIIYHVVPAEYYDQQPTGQPYRPPRFEEEGFIHCTKGDERTLLVANTVYRKTPGKFWLLVIDERQVEAEIRYEIVGEILFPHIHGPLNRDAIVRVQEMGRAEDGTFLSIVSLRNGAAPAPPDELSVNPAALAAEASIEDVLLETRRLRQLATERISVLEQEIQAYLEGRPAPLAAPAKPAPPQAIKIPVSAEPGERERLARLEAHVVDLRSLLVDRMDKLETRVAALEKKAARARPPASKVTASKATAKKPVKKGISG